MNASPPSTARTVNGVPAPGLGTWQNTDPDQCVRSVRTALEAGYRHVDTARAYGNEEVVGDGIAAADVPREEVFLATKVWIDELAYDDVIAVAQDSRERLGVDTIDLLYVHWPADTYEPEDTLPAFDELRDRGVIDAVGVSNFLPEQIDHAREVLDSPIVAHQFECHPLLPRSELLADASEHGHAPVAYSPLARGEVFEQPTIVDIADRHDATPAQISLAWLLEHGAVPIPKATGREHILENLRALDIALTDDDLARIDAIEEHSRIVDPGFAPW